VMPYLNKALRQDPVWTGQVMLLKATNELFDGQRHLFTYFLCSPLPVILIRKPDRLSGLIYFQNAMSRNGHLMSISTKIFHYLLWPAKRTFSVNVPSLKANFMQQVFRF